MTFIGEDQQKQHLKVYAMPRIDGKWVLKFEAPVGTRLHHHYLWAKTFGDCWWSENKKKFMSYIDIEGNCRNCSPQIRTLKAFKRFLRKHPELQGREVILVSRYVGHSVTANWVI